MSTRYQVRLFNTSGTQVAIFDDWISLNIEHRVNSFSTHTFSIYGLDSRISLFTTDSILEVWRRDIENNIAWYREYFGFHRSPQRNLTEDMQRIFTSYGRGLLDLINRRTIRYPADTVYTVKKGPSETVIKEYVDENAGPSATAPPRLSNGVVTGLSIEADVARGDSWEGGKAYDNLLSAIQEIAIDTNIDFNIVPVTQTTFDFRAYSPQLGTDRTSSSGNPPVVFTPEHGNMLAPTYIKSRTTEVTNVLVLGQGEGTRRMYVIRESSAKDDSPWNLIEQSFDQRNKESPQALVSAGDNQLEINQAKENVTFTVLQQPSSLYGKDYFLGDLVTLKFDDIEIDKKIIAVKLNVSESNKPRDRIGIEFGDIP